MENPLQASINQVLSLLVEDVAYLRGCVSCVRPDDEASPDFYKWTMAIEGSAKGLMLAHRAAGTGASDHILAVIESLTSLRAALEATFLELEKAATEANEKRIVTL